MTVAQKVPFELVALDGPAGGFTDAHADRRRAGRGHRGNPRSRPLAAAAVRRLGIGLARRRRDHADGRRTPRHHRPVPGRGPADRRRRRLASKSSSASKAARTRSRAAPAPPAVLGWATGNLPEPRNNPQVGMANMRTIMPALQKAKAAPVAQRRPAHTSASHCPSSSARRAS